jgi:tetratricopeptide (TPR) repeat protein
MLQNRQKFDLRQRELAIDVYFVAEKLQLYIDRATREQNWGTPLTDPLILSLMELVDRSTELQNIPLVELHYQTVRCFSDNSVELFTAFLDFLLKNGAFFPYDELRRAYTFAENCCAIQIRQGNSVYWQQLLDLYRLEILTQIIYNPNGSISTPLFRNVITVAMRLGEYDWGLDFIETNKERLPLSEREDVYQYNIANLYFHQKNYDKVLDLLNTIHYLNILYKLAARTLRLKTYYELKSTEPYYENLLESELTAFKAFIYRLEGIEKEDKTLYRNFMLFLEKLVRLNFTDQKKKQALYQKISSTAMVAEKVWLMKSCE